MSKVREFSRWEPVAYFTGTNPQRANTEIRLPGNGLDWIYATDGVPIGYVIGKSALILEPKPGYQDPAECVKGC